MLDKDLPMIEAVAEVLNETKQELEFKINTVVKSIDAINISSNEISKTVIESIENLRVKQVEDFDQLSKGLIAEVASQLNQVKDGSDGIHGVDGKDGRDGIDRPLIAPVVILQNEKVSKNTEVHHRGGLFVSTRKANGNPDQDPFGYQLAVNGVTDVEFKELTDREKQITIELTDGEKKDFVFSTHSPIFKGTFSKEATYEVGDIVIKDKKTLIKVDEDSWKMFVFAEKGEKGDTGIGIQGKDGLGINDIFAEGSNLLFEMTDGHVKAVSFEIPVEHFNGTMRFRGHYDQTESYLESDVVKFEEALWIALRDTKAMPELRSNDWLVMVYGAGAGNFGYLGDDGVVNPPTGGEFLPLAGGTMTGTIVLPVMYQALRFANNRAIGAYTSGIRLSSANVNLNITDTGVTTNSSLTLPLANPVAETDATHKKYVDSKFDSIVIPPSFTLNPATATILGGIKVGSGLSVTGDGTLSSSARQDFLPLAGGTMSGAITLPNLPNALKWTTGGAFVGSANGTDLILASGTHTVTISNAAVVSTLDIQIPSVPGSDNSAVTKGYVDSKFSGGGYVLPAASSTVLGGVKVGSGLAVTADGILSATAQQFTLPIATTTTLGGIKVGSGLAVNADGVVSTTGAYLPIAGGAMTGPLVVQSPTQSTNPATKGYVDAMVNNANSYFLSMLGGTMEGDLILAHDPVLPLEASTKQYVDKRLPLEGGTMTGSITFPAQKGIAWDDQTYIVAYGSKYMKIRAGAVEVELNGLQNGMSVNFPISAVNPTLPYHVATKAYVDSMVAAMQATIDEQSKTIKDLQAQMQAIALKVGL